MKYCKNCGSQLEDDAMFCDECGTQQVKKQQDAKSATAQRQVKKVVSGSAIEENDYLENSIDDCSDVEECDNNDFSEETKKAVDREEELRIIRMEYEKLRKQVYAIPDIFVIPFLIGHYFIITRIVGTPLQHGGDEVISFSILYGVVNVAIALIYYWIERKHTDACDLTAKYYVGLVLVCAFYGFLVWNSWSGPTDEIMIIVLVLMMIFVLIFSLLIDRNSMKMTIHIWVLGAFFLEVALRGIVILVIVGILIMVMLGGVRSNLREDEFKRTGKYSD